MSIYYNTIISIYYNTIISIYYNNTNLACKVRRLMGRCKRKDNQQSHLQQIQQACADVEVGLRGLQGTLRSSNI